MRPLRMQSPVEAFQKSGPLTGPFVQVGEKEWWIHLGQRLAPRVSRCRERGSGHQARGNLVEEALNERAKLRICGGPVSAGMGGNGLIEMPLRRHEAELFQQCVNLVVCLRQIQRFGESPTERTILDGEAVALKTAVQRREILTETRVVECMGIPIDAPGDSTFDKARNNRVREIAAVVIQQVGGVQEMPTHCARAISKITLDAGIFQTVSEDKAVNRTVTTISDQIGGGEDCTSSELRHMRLGNGKTMSCAHDRKAASAHPGLIHKIRDVAFHFRSSAESYPLQHFKYCIIVQRNDEAAVVFERVAAAVDE